MAIYSDERGLWSSEQEDLSVLLENKSRDDVYDILENYKYLFVESKRPKKSAWFRAIQILTIPISIIFLCLMPLKWILTGDKHLDSWVKFFRINPEYFL